MALKPAVRTTDQAEPDQAELESLTATADSQAVATISPDNLALGEFGGDTDDVRIRLPFLQVASGQGKLDKFVKGSLVIGDENLIASPGKPVNIVVLAARAYFKEYVGGASYDPTYIPKAFSTKAEVVANGGIVDWVPGGKPPTYKVAISARVLVQQPEGVVCGLFGVQIGGKMFAPCAWNLDKTAAAMVAPVLKSDTTFSLKSRGLVAGVYELTTREIVFKNGHKTYAPNIRLVSYNSDEVVDQIKALFKRDIETPVDVSAGAV